MPKDEYHLSELAKATEGFNGADIESVVNDTVERCYIKTSKVINNSDLLETIRNTVSISKSCRKQIESIKVMFAENCFKDATTGKVSFASKK